MKQNTHGVTKDDKRKAAIYKCYDYNKGNSDEEDYRLATKIKLQATSGVTVNLTVNI